MTSADSSHDGHLSVRTYEETDAATVRELIVASFAASEHGHHGEAELVERLRLACPDPSEDRIELVAELAPRAGVAPVVVGHVMFSPATIGDVAGLGLAPVAVAVDQQRRGIAKRLIDEGLALARRRGCPFVIVLGDPAYYPRFGFERASSHAVDCPYPGVPDEAFMLALLDPSRRTALRGLAGYHSAFAEL